MCLIYSVINKIVEIVIRGINIFGNLIVWLGEENNCKFYYLKKNFLLI